MRCEILPPGACPPAALDEFEAFVCTAGRVSSTGLRVRIRNARWLAFGAADDRTLIAVGALKVPPGSHRRTVFGKAGAADEGDRYSLELGLLAVASEHRRRGYGAQLCRELLARVEGSPVFATTEGSNSGMLHILGQLGFGVRGNAFESPEHPGSPIRLLIRSGS